MKFEESIPRKRWSAVELGEICEIRLGKMLSPASKRGLRPVPYLRNVNVQWDRFELSDVAEMDFDERQESALSLRPGDLLVCEGGEPGRAAVWEGQIERCCYQKALHRLRPLHDSVDPRFLMYRLWLGGFTNEFTFSNAKTTIAHLPAVRLRKMSVMLPDITEQRRIAARLREQIAEVERARIAMRAQIDAAETLVLALLRESLKTSGRRTWRIPECLSEITEGVGERWSVFPVLGATRAGLAPAKENVGKNPGRYKPVTPGTVFYNPMRILLGSIAMMDDGDQPGITSPDYVVMRGIEGRLHPTWFYYWFRSPAGAEFIQSLTRGAVRERLLFNRLASAELEIPRWEAQLKVVARLREVHLFRRTLEKRLAEIDLLPAALLRQAFSPVP